MAHAPSEGENAQLSVDPFGRGPPKVAFFFAATLFRPIIFFVLHWEGSLDESKSVTF